MSLALARKKLLKREGLGKLGDRRNNKRAIARQDIAMRTYFERTPVCNTDIYVYIYSCVKYVNLFCCRERGERAIGIREVQTDRQTDG